MPELPEAETICRQLAKQVISKTINAIFTGDNRILRHPKTPASVRRLLKGRRISDVYRRGKAVIILLDNNYIMIIRLGMSGTLKVESAEAPFDKHTHLRLLLDNGEELRFRDPRKFGGVTIRKGTDVDLTPEFCHCGPEPLSAKYDPAYLEKALKGRKAQLGVILMDQRIVAGIGKIYSDEICFLAGIRPTRAAGSLKKAEYLALAKATVEVIERAIGDRGTSAKDNVYIDAYGLLGGFRPAVYQRTGEPCVKCGEPIRRTSLTGGRGLHWCPKCQK